MFNILCSQLSRPLFQCAPWVGQTGTDDEGLQFVIYCKNCTLGEIIDILILCPTTLMICAQTLEYLGGIP